MTVHQIINVINERPNGAEKVALSLHEGLLERRISSRLVSLVDYDESGIEDFYPLSGQSPYDIRAIFRLRKYIQSNCSAEDVIHTHLFPTNFFVAMAAKLAGFRGRLVTTEHNTSNRRRGTLWGKLVDGVTYRAYQKIFCISDATQQSLEEWVSEASNRTSIISNGVSLQFSGFNARAASPIVRIVSVGRLHRQKNYETALRAFSILNTRVGGEKSIEYQIAGSGPDEAKLCSLIEELGLESSVTLLGYTEDVSSLLANADVFLMTSEWEGFGLAAVEGMNAGLPCVASDVPGLREVVGTDQKAGILVEQGNESDFASALESLVRDSSLRERMGQEGFRRSLEFSSMSMLDRYLAAYEEAS